MTQNGYGKASRRVGEVTWGDVATPEIEHEDRLPEEAAVEVWGKIYQLFDATGEESQKEVKLAVYAYYAVNGASRRTMHARDINTGGGANVIASDVRDAIGESKIRQFLRADVDEAYSALKESKTLENDEVFVHKSMKKGVPRGFMHCAVDYLRGCSLFTVEEEAYYDKHFTTSIVRARGARGGMTLEDQEKSDRQDSLNAQREVRRGSHVELDEY